MTILDFETARAARGLRMVYAENVPSPWTQAALGLFHMKGLDVALVPFRKHAAAIREHTGATNAPVVLFDDESPRTGWADILALAERLDDRVRLVPADAEGEARLYGLAHLILSEGGLVWNVRLLTIHLGLTTDGREGWPLTIASYLAPKYGYAAERAPAARTRAIALLNLLAETAAQAEAEGHAYLLGKSPTALDVYAATALASITPLPHQMCPMPAIVRHALETGDAAVRAAVPPALLRHREMMYARHLELPVRL